jgi:hypothetical protein
MANPSNKTNNVKAPIIKVVTVLPNLGNTKVGEMFLLVDGGSDNNKIHVRAVTGWIKTAALS